LYTGVLYAVGTSFSAIADKSALGISESFQPVTVVTM